MTILYCMPHAFCKHLICCVRFVWKTETQYLLLISTIKYLISYSYNRKKLKTFLYPVTKEAQVADCSIKFVHRLFFFLLKKCPFNQEHKSIFYFFQIFCLKSLLISLFFCRRHCTACKEKNARWFGKIFIICKTFKAEIVLQIWSFSNFR